MFDGENILVTGASGLIGRHLIKLLLEKGSSIRAIVGSRQLPSDITEMINVVHGDLSEPTFCKRDYFRRHG